MILTESARSYIDDPEMMRLLKHITYYGDDIRDTWIGPYQPATLSTDPGLNDYVRGNTIHYLYYLNFVEEFMQPGWDVLDIGSGCGARASMLARYAKSVTALESDPGVLGFALERNHAPNITYVCSEFPQPDFIRGFPYKPYDAIFMVEVIEHVTWDRQIDFIATALSILKPGGLLFLTTPANEEDNAKPHVGIWTAEQLGKILTAFGRRIVHLSHLDRDLWETGDVRSDNIKASHHRLVLQA